MWQFLKVEMLKPSQMWTQKKGKKGSYDIQICLDDLILLEKILRLLRLGKKWTDQQKGYILEVWR